MYRVGKKPEKPTAEMIFATATSGKNLREVAMQFGISKQAVLRGIHRECVRRWNESQRPLGTVVGEMLQCLDALDKLVDEASLMSVHAARSMIFLKIDSGAERQVHQARLAILAWARREASAREDWETLRRVADVSGDPPGPEAA